MFEETYQISSDSFKFSYNGEPIKFKNLLKTASFTPSTVGDLSKKSNTVQENVRKSSSAEHPIIISSDQKIKDIKGNSLKKTFERFLSLNDFRTDDQINLFTDQNKNKRKWTLLKYEKGCFFNSHTDGKISSNHIATMILLPPKSFEKYKGGKLILNCKPDNQIEQPKQAKKSNSSGSDDSDSDDNNSDDEHSYKNTIITSDFDWKLVIIPVGMYHKVKPIESGVRYYLKTPLILEDLKPPAPKLLEKKINDDLLYEKYYGLIKEPLTKTFGRDVAKIICKYAIKFLIEIYTGKVNKEYKIIDEKKTENDKLVWVENPKVYFCLRQELSKNPCLIFLGKYYKNPDVEKLDIFTKKLISNLYTKLGDSVSIELGNLYGALGQLGDRSRTVSIQGVQLSEHRYCSTGQLMGSGVKKQETSIMTRYENYDNFPEFPIFNQYGFESVGEKTGDQIREYNDEYTEYSTIYNVTALFIKYCAV